MFANFFSNEDMGCKRDNIALIYGKFRTYKQVFKKTILFYNFMIKLLLFLLFGALLSGLYFLHNSSENAFMISASGKTGTF